MSTSLEWKDKPVKYLRDQVVDQLKYNLTHNHLEIDEFDQMVRIALNTQSKTELLSLTTDLPAKTESDLENINQELARINEFESFTNILSSSKRKGIWTVPKLLKVLNVLGDTLLDFRDVQLKPEIKYLSLNCILGNVKIIIPPDVNVVSNIKNVLGAVKGESYAPMNPNSPTIVIEGKVVLGDVTIEVKKPSNR